MVSSNFPTPFELRCGGASLIIANILWIVAFWLEQIDHDLFAVATNESVIKLHEEISSPQHRFKVEVSCALLWLSFPLLLAAVHVIKKGGMSIHQGTSAELFVTIMDKAFTLAIGISMVILPALSLTAVTFDWDYGQPAADGTAPSGYWIQLYLTLYEIEVIDCLAVTDGTFLITYFGLALYNLYLVNQKDDPRYTDWNEWKNKTICGCCKYCYEVMIICICGPLVVIFFMILFEFAESGFFSIYDNVNAGLLCIWAFIVKIIMGIRWIQIAKSSNYSTWKRNCEIMNQGRGSNINNGQAYQMAPLQDPDQDVENGVNL